MKKKGIEGMEEGTQREESASELGEIVKKKEKFKSMEFSGILDGEGRITLLRNDRRRLYIQSVDYDDSDEWEAKQKCNMHFVMISKGKLPFLWGGWLNWVLLRVVRPDQRPLKAIGVVGVGIGEVLSSHNDDCSTVHLQKLFSFLHEVLSWDVDAIYGHQFLKMKGPGHSHGQLQ